MTFGADLTRAFGESRVRTSAPLAPLTTLRVGGPADWLLDIETVAELQLAIALARAAREPVTVIGAGSNLLVSDAGVRGLVLRFRGSRIVPLGAGRVGAEAGATLNGLVRWTIAHGQGGLAEWAGTPGTVGGAVFGNAHWAGRGIGDVVAEAQVVTADAQLATLARDDLEFAYDSSRLQRTGEILVEAVFALTPNTDADVLRRAARDSLGRRKRTQPLTRPTAGCVFKNPDPRVDRLPDGIPPSAGALIERAGLKGHAVGNARVSAVHANFIVNEGGATAAEISALIETCRREVARAFGVTLHEEIRRVGEFADPWAGDGDQRWRS